MLTVVSAPIEGQGRTLPPPHGGETQRGNGVKRMSVFTIVFTPRPSAEECPQGGRHEWTISGHIATCSKCGATRNVS